MNEKKILMIIGPNGAGKTTISYEMLMNGPKIYEFLNADEIARGLAPIQPEKVPLEASKIMVRRLQHLLVASENIAFESTGAGINYVKYIKQAQALGYEINLIFLYLKSPDQAIKRVMQRVSQGGHDIPSSTIVRRFYSGVKNAISVYLPLSDKAIILDNSGEDFKVIARKMKGKQVDILEKTTWDQLEILVYGR
ncbi:MAG: zeta toxin family protein [Chlamydiia bacterium]|nr:zeta toxin family protein [Chlamydiia bacterium]MCB1116196.1 zeta toxin family protein [Chlamydiia bacterium]